MLFFYVGDFRDYTPGRERWENKVLFRLSLIPSYFSSGCFVIAIQREFWDRFNLASLVLVSDPKSIVVSTFRRAASATTRRTGVLPLDYLRILRQLEFTVAGAF